MRARTFSLPFLLSALILAAPSAALAAAAPDTAVFDFAFVDSSPQPETPAEAARLAHLTAALRQALERSGQYHVVDVAPIKGQLASVNDIHDCNGCEIDLAKKLGAQCVVVAWVQKVSDLILNISIRIEDVKTGRTLRGGSVDIRGNTDVSWDRGLKYLLEEHIFGNRP